MRFEQNDELAADIVFRRFHTPVSAPYAGFVERHEGRPVVAVILNVFTGHDVHVTVAAERPISVSAFREIHRMCFDGLKVSRVTAVTRESNAAARANLKRIGFQQEGILRMHFGNEDGIIYGLTRADIRHWRAL